MKPKGDKLPENYHRKFQVLSDAHLKLKHFDPAFHGKFDSRDEALPMTQKYVEKMGQLQYLLYSENTHSVLIVLQGLDGAGKDGVIRHVFSAINPQGCTVTGFKQPTAEEKAHDFLWRVHPFVPRKGWMAIFNRSYYEDVLVERVHGLVPEKQWSRRYDLINDFEKLLLLENKTVVLKFFLHISKEEQLKRFKKRLDDPARNWKISESDYQEREYWGDYKKAYEELLQKTSTEHAPWFIIPSDHKWFRNLAISQILTDTLEKLKMKEPSPKVDLAEIRRKYHAAEKEEKISRRNHAR